MNLELCDLYEDLQSEIRELSGFARLLLLSVQTKTVKDELEGQLHILCRCFRDLEKRADGFYPFLKNAAVPKPEETPKDLPIEEEETGELSAVLYSLLLKLRDLCRVLNEKIGDNNDQETVYSLSVLAKEISEEAVCKMQRCYR